jgi:hypothetical protein
MIQGKTNVFSIAGWNEHYQCKYIPFILIFYANYMLGTEVYCYVFLNIETRIAYSTMFRRLFIAFEKIALQQVTFAYLHGQGIQTVTIDMCKKQARGMLIYYYLFI